MRKEFKTYFNITIVILLVAASVAWMVTVASQGEIVEYDRDLIINTLDIDVHIYQYNTTTLEWDEVITPVITINNMAPNDTKSFKIDLTNNGNTRASTSIVFANITGDVEALQNSLYFGSTAPTVKEIKLADVIEENENNGYMFRFYDQFKIEPLETKSLYWYISMDKTASNEIADKTLSIEHINFIKP